MEGNRQSAAMEEQRRFVEHLEEATTIVRTWPVWKQAVLGGVQVNDPATEPQKNLDRDVHETLNTEHQR